MGNDNEDVLSYFHMHKHPSKLSYLIVLILAITLWPTTKAKAEEYSCNQDPIYSRHESGITTVASRIRNMPCMQESSILNVVPAQKNIKILAETDGWYKVEYDGVTGWMGASLINMAGNSTSPSPAANQTAKLTVKIIGIDEFNFKKLENRNADLINRLRNMIVLRVNHFGKAYLIKEDGLLKPLTGEEVKAYKQNSGTKTTDEPAIKAVVKIRKIVGVTEQDFLKLQNGDQALLNRLKDMLILRVQSHGEAYWVMTTGGLKFLTKSEIGDYLTSGTTKEPVKTENPKTKEIPVVSQQNGQMYLQGNLIEPGKVKLTWSLTDMTSPNGFKVVISEQMNPVYPGNDYHYLTDPARRDDIWSGLKAGKTYHFRVCEYLGGKCGKYSNDIAIEVAANEAQANEMTAGNINLTVNVSDQGKAALNWELTDMTSPKGFKTVISEQPNPVYPGNDYHYLTDPDLRTDTWSNLESGQTYHFRVCEYLGGSCGTYSNDVSIVAK